MHKLHQRSGKKALREVAPPVVIGRPSQVDACEVQQIKAIENGALDRASAILHGGEGWLAGSVESHEFPVEDHAVYGLRAKLCDQAREVTCEINAAPGPERSAAVRDEREGAVAVQLRLPHPGGIVECGFRELRMHRGERCGDGALVAAWRKALRGHFVRPEDRLLLLKNASLPSE